MWRSNNHISPQEVKIILKEGEGICGGDGTSGSYFILLTFYFFFFRILWQPCWKILAIHGFTSLAMDIEDPFAMSIFF
jgi:hypothetical protein